MSLTTADLSFLDAASQWINNHYWQGSGQSGSVLVVQESNQAYIVQSENLDDIQIIANYTPGVDQLNYLTISLDVPIFGPVLLAQASSYQLSSDAGTNLTVNVADLITGGLTFQYVGDSGSEEVFVNYYLQVPYSALPLNVSISIFPANMQGIQTDNVSGGQPPEEADNQLLTDFFADHVANETIFIDSFSSASGGGTSNSKQARDSSSLYSIDTHFAKIIHLVVNVDSELKVSGNLYLDFPVIGDTRIGVIKGSLDSAVVANIDVAIASGSVTLTSSDNPSGGVDVYAQITLNTKFGKINLRKFFVKTITF